jgi:ribose transport system substrate-binding protein
VKRIAPAGMARAAARLAIASIVVAACSSSATPAPSAAPSAAPSVAPSVAPSAAPSAAPSVAPSPSPSPKAYKVGYISLGESIPFVATVTNGLREEAAKAGVDLVVCDSEVDAAKALACAQNLKVQQVQAVINFQLFEDSAPEICAAYGGVPTLAIDIHQPPCEVAFMGADNTLAGTVVGEYVGNSLKAENNCTYEAVVTLDAKGAGATTLARMNGMIDGFESVCGKIPADKFRSLDAGISTDVMVTAFGDTLSAIKPGGQIVVLSLNDDMATGALAAARTAGRDKELRIGAQNADQIAWKEIACNPSWLADAAYFPDKYGATAIPAIIKILNGETVDPASLLTKHVAVTKDNVRTIFPETPACQ